MAGNPDIVSFILTMLLGGTLMLGLLVMVLLIRSDLGMSKYLLSLTLIAMMTLLLTFLLFISQVIYQWPHLLGITYPFIFLAGPAFYYFIISYTEPEFRFLPRHLIHLLPFLMVIAWMSPLYGLTTVDKLEMITYYYELAPTDGLTGFEWVYLNLHAVVILVYVIASLYYTHGQKPPNPLRKFCWLFLELSLLYLVLQSGLLLSGSSLITSEIILSILMALVILLTSYWVLDIKQLMPVVNNFGKYQTSPLSTERADEIERKLKLAIEGKELYLNPRLKISDLANALQVPSHHLSQVLNDKMHTNFYQLINKYRIEKSKEMLRTDRIHQVSIQGIGYDCGFSNKTSFYRAFKKETGMTPAEYAHNVEAKSS